MIRAAREDDIGWILALSARHETETSPLDAGSMPTDSTARHTSAARSDVTTPSTPAASGDSGTQK